MISINNAFFTSNQMHISGESLLNDGSLVVLFNIFSAIFFHELKIPGFVDQFTLSEGFTYFFRLSLGGCAIGENAPIDLHVSLALIFDTSLKLTQQLNLYHRAGLWFRYCSNAETSQPASFRRRECSPGSSDGVLRLPCLLHFRDFVSMLWNYGNHSLWDNCQGIGRNIHQ